MDWEDLKPKNLFFKNIYKRLLHTKLQAMSRSLQLAAAVVAIEQLVQVVGALE